MNAKAGSGLWVENEVATDPVQQQACDVRESFFRQLCGMLDATMREKWLPMGFRALVVQEFPAMRNLLERRRVDYLKFEAHVSHLLEEAEPYKTFAKRSAALLLLKTMGSDLKSLAQTKAA